MVSAAYRAILTDAPTRNLDQVANWVSQVGSDPANALTGRGVTVGPARVQSLRSAAKSARFGHPRASCSPCEPELVGGRDDQGESLDAVVPRTVISVSGVFVPGWGAHAGIYRGAVPAGWEILEPPSFVASGATVAAYRRWIVERCRARPGPFTLAGHSFGAVLAVHAALAEGVEVERLVLVSPSALPLEKPVPLMFWDFSRRVAAGWFPPREAARAVRQVLFHPLLARRLGMEVRAIDLSEELEQLRDRGLPCTIVAASTDTLTPPSLCRRVADLCGGDYREVDVPGGHLWFLRAHDLLASELSAGGG